MQERKICKCAWQGRRHESTRWLLRISSAGSQTGFGYVFTQPTRMTCAPDAVSCCKDTASGAPALLAHIPSAFKVDAESFCPIQAEDFFANKRCSNGARAAPPFRESPPRRLAGAAAGTATGVRGAFSEGSVRIVIFCRLASALFAMKTPAYST